jgi:hypothetical protein
MSNSREAARCTVRDGAVYMYLDNDCVDIPSHLWSKSALFMDTVSSVSDSLGPQDFTLAAPRAWLQAWVNYYAKKEHALADASIENLVNCLLVRLCIRNLTSLVLHDWLVCTCFRCVHRVASSSLKFALHLESTIKCQLFVCLTRRWEGC